MSEYHLHLAVADYLRRVMPSAVPWWHTGQTAQNARHGATLKRMGVRAGVPDFSFVLPPQGRYAAIELKDDDGRQTGSQAEFESHVHGAGALYAICRSIDEVEGTLSGWGIQLKGSIA